MNYKPEELMITVIARLLGELKAYHVAVGAASPIPGSAALLARHMSGGRLRASIIHGITNNPFTDGGREIFDCAGQGRIDVFFLGGVQIDGEANINLVGTGDYPRVDKRFPGSFGSAFMYFVVPNVILFRPEHTRRVFVPKVDFISAPGTSEPNVYRPGGPKALVTELCLMSFNPSLKRFRLESLHPGRTVEEVRDNTGFDFDTPNSVPITEEPDTATLNLLRSTVSLQISEIYPNFVHRVLN
ncbi:MAG: CoA synthetase [Rhodospirillaceae bacterium TMED8]|nr:CoA synthetase [Magnetovibrio sp.]OUT51926.1 MAG: CoA synthetase [Rhodospirillaceae bacterium TMED8]